MRHASVPKGSSTLHKHYEETSTSGAGASIKNEGVVAMKSREFHKQNQGTSSSGRGTSSRSDTSGPRGFAEYTGTGSDTEHNTKVVLDYIGKRAYLTLTHYQRWALVKYKGKSDYVFWYSKTQSNSMFEGDMGKLKDCAAHIIEMSPWIEILMPMSDEPLTSSAPTKQREKEKEKTNMAGRQTRGVTAKPEREQKPQPTPSRGVKEPGSSSGGKV
jgi:hypothetical protein